MTEDPKPPSLYAPVRVPEELDHAVLKTLKKSPDERYTTLQEFRTALARIKVTIDADTKSPDEVVLPLNRELRRNTQQPAETIPAKRKGPGQRKPVVEAIVFAAVLLVTALLVGVVVSMLRHATRDTGNPFPPGQSSVALPRPRGHCVAGSIPQAPGALRAASERLTNRAIAITEGA